MPARWLLPLLALAAFFRRQLLPVFAFAVGFAWAAGLAHQRMSDWLSPELGAARSAPPRGWGLPYEVPGPGLELADWLAARGVALTGCDTWSYGPVPAEDPARPFEVPQVLNVHHGVFVVENLDTSALAADGVREFALVLTHPKLRGATGAWVSPIALV